MQDGTQFRAEGREVVSGEGEARKVEFVAGTDAAAVIIAASFNDLAAKGVPIVPTAVDQIDKA